MHENKSKSCSKKMIVLTEQHLSTLKTHAEQSYPGECCGFILGAKNNEKYWTVGEIRPVPNQRRCHKRYEIDPRDWLRCRRIAADKKMQIIGIYHSHPDAAATLSQSDLSTAWTEYFYAIIAVSRGKAHEVSFYQFGRQRKKTTKLIQKKMEKQ